MATAELSVVHLDAAPLRPSKPGEPGQPLHRIQEVRRLQGMSLRTAARQLQTDVRSIRAQEQATSDLRLSDLYRWQAALEVPIGELLVEDDEPLSRSVKDRAQMVKVMKTARALLEAADNPATRRMAENLVEQLTEVMPELAEVSPWHSVGQRRGIHEMGRIAEQVVCDDFGFGGELPE
ncbi:MAG: helix-turn-helix transcriptional regulator [Pirellulaceae bacterium]|nr:helix-turn-helix transcriptional regulator [Pirellulaceae bacterium]